MFRYYKAFAAMAISATLFLASSLCVYANNDYLAYNNPETEMEATTSTTVTVDYVGNYVYENGTLTKILFKGGYVDMTGSTPKYMYYLTDHLGNVRVMADASGNAVQVNHYYPYGDRLNDNRYALSSSSTSDNDHLFGGKEFDSSSGLHDFEARYDNTRFGRFTTMDPMAEKYYGVSPYSYCANNPVKRIDYTGKDWYSINSDGLISFYEGGQNEDFDRLFIDGNFDINSSLVLYDTKILLNMARSGYIPGSTNRKDALSVFYYAADSYLNQEWGLYFDGKRYALRTDKSIDSVTSPFYQLNEHGSQIDVTIWKIHSHSDTPDNEKQELDSMGYWAPQEAYDSNGKYIPGHYSVNATGDWLLYRESYDARSPKTSLVYFPVSKRVYKINYNKRPSIVSK